MNEEARSWVRRLKLRSHPEGGYYRETYRSTESVAKNALPKRFRGPRAISTAIYFLLVDGRPSRFHRIRSDETWHFYAGAPLDIVMLQPGGRLARRRLNRLRPQTVVPAGVWFAARTRGAYSLTGCTVAPGFDFGDFELADASQLRRSHPRYARLIASLT